MTIDGDGGTTPSRTDSYFDSLDSFQFCLTFYYRTTIETLRTYVDTDFGNDRTGRISIFSSLIKFNIKTTNVGFMRIIWTRFRFVSGFPLRGSAHQEHLKTRGETVARTYLILKKKDAVTTFFQIRIVIRDSKSRGYQVEWSRRSVVYRVRGVGTRTWGRVEGIW